MAASDTESDGGSVEGQELLVLWRCLGVLGRLGRVLVQPRNCLIFKMPSLITLSIPDSADLK